jgi:uncharacterized protein (TIGR02444 family)
MAEQPDLAEAFWRFSLLLYARPGAAEALIGLQDRAGHNVNLILFGLWLGLCEKSRIDPATLARAAAAIAGIEGRVVAPLRGLRRAMKVDPDPDVQALRRRVLAVELAAERRVQARLVASIARRRDTAAVDRQAAAEANLRLILGEDFGSAEARLLRRVAAALRPASQG